MGSFSFPGSDTDRLIRLQAGDESALQELIELYFADVASIAYHYVKQEDVAFDIAQDIFIRIWDRRHTLGRHGEFIHYLRRAARNGALNALRAQATRSRTIDSLAAESVVYAPYDENLALKALEGEEYLKLLHEVTATMSPRVQEIALLHYERGLEPGEIAKLLEIAPRTVYNQLRTAMAAFTSALVGRSESF